MLASFHLKQRRISFCRFKSLFVLMQTASAGIYFCFSTLSTQQLFGWAKEELGLINVSTSPAAALQLRFWPQSQSRAREIYLALRSLQETAWCSYQCAVRGELIFCSPSPAGGGLVFISPEIRTSSMIFSTKDFETFSKDVFKFSSIQKIHDLIYIDSPFGNIAEYWTLV